MYKIKKFLHKFFSELFYIILAILVSIGTPFVLLSILPIHIFRFLLGSYVKYFKSNTFGKILSARSTIFAVDDIYTAPRCTLCVLLTVRGDLSVEEFKSIITNRLLNAKLKPESNSNDELLHPELKQYITNWLGFYFWKPCVNFNLDDHVKVPAFNSTINEDVVFNYNKTLVGKPFVKGKSPWEFHLLRNYIQKGSSNDEILTGIIFYVHHALADGFSVLNLMRSSSDSIFDTAKPSPTTLKVLQKPKKSCWKFIWDQITFTLRIPYEAMKGTIESYDLNEWHNPIVARKLSICTESGYHPAIPLQMLKDVKNNYGVSLTSVILEICTGAVRNFMLMHKIKVPAKIHCFSALPLPQHPKKLRNYMTGCFIALPVGIADPIERLHKIEKHLTTLRESTYPWTTSFFIPICGGLFSWLVKPLTSIVTPTALVTNFPGPDRQVDFFNRPLHLLDFGGGLLIGNISVGMASISYNGKISFVIGLDKAICPTHNSDPNAKAESDNNDVGPTLVELISEELKALRSFRENDV